jgi:AraC-like DNA-binding protein
VTPVPPARHLLRAKDLVDARYRDPLDVPTLARAAHLSPAHFSREFRRTFGDTPHQYLLMRRLERAAALLRNTDYSVAEICVTVGFSSVGSFTTTFRKTFCVLLAQTRLQTAAFEKTANGGPASVETQTTDEGGRPC